MVYILFAEGFEEQEAITTVDILIRGGVDVKTVGVTGKSVASVHGIEVKCDLGIDEVQSGFEAVILPGGIPGTPNLEKDERVQKLIDEAVNKDAFVCAICAAPTILGHKGLLKGKKAICYPSLEPQLTGAVITDTLSVRDGKIITGKGPGASKEFGFEILKALKGEDAVKTVKEEMCYLG